MERLELTIEGMSCEHCVRAVNPGFGNLARIDDEILGENRPVIGLPNGGEIVERPAEIWRVGKDADRIGYPRVGACDRRRIALRT